MMKDGPALAIENSTVDGQTIVRPSGKLDTLTARDFETHLKQQVDAKAGSIFIDMAAVDYVTSFGLRSILVVAKQLAPFGHKLVLFSVNESVLDVLRISGFLKIVTVATTEAQALKSAADTASQTASEPDA